MEEEYQTYLSTCLTQPTIVYCLWCSSNLCLCSTTMNAYPTFQCNANEGVRPCLSLLLTQATLMILHAVGFTVYLICMLVTYNDIIQAAGFNPGTWALLALGPVKLFHGSAAMIQHYMNPFSAFWAYMWIRHHVLIKKKRNHVHHVHFTAKHRIVKDFATCICNLHPVAILVNSNIRTVKLQKAPRDMKY